jgi:hypothetical protein
MSLNGFSPNLENNEPIPFKVGIKKWNYDAIKKFQDNGLQNSHGLNYL